MSVSYKSKLRVENGDDFGEHRRGQWLVLAAHGGGTANVLPAWYEMGYPCSVLWGPLEGGFPTREEAEAALAEYREAGGRG